MELTATLSTMLGLLAQFVQERRAGKDAQHQATIQEYTEWLRRREHADAVGLLESNKGLMMAVQHMLNAGHDELLERFDRLESMLNLFLGSTAEWGELVKSIDPKAGLSDQAIDILRWFDDTGTSTAIRADTRKGAFLVSDGEGGNYDPSEPRFFADDMATFVNLGLLILGYGPDGSSNYTITRSAVEFVKSLPGPAGGRADIPA